jgi:hypothetical protein
VTRFPRQPLPHSLTYSLTRLLTFTHPIMDSPFGASSVLLWLRMGVLLRLSGLSYWQVNWAVTLIGPCLGRAF